jgi:hypothetical protein
MEAREKRDMKTRAVASMLRAFILVAVLAVVVGLVGAAWAAEPAKPNIILIVSDDTLYGDLGPYGGGEGRGMPTPGIDRPAEDFKINGQYVNTPDKGVVGIPFFDGYIEKAALDYLDRAAKSDKPFFMNVNFMKVHQPNLPHPDYVHKSIMPRMASRCSLRSPSSC